MSITPQIRADIMRLFHADHFTMNAIAEALGIHHDTVKSTLQTQKFSSSSANRGVSALNPYLPTIEEALKLYPKIRATRIFQMIKDRGYQGSISSLRERVRSLRPVAIKAFMPLTFLAGEQGQVDWAHFGKLQAENTDRKLSCFVMVLSYSRTLFAYFTFDQTLESFLRCHIKAFRYFEGIPRKLLYDNLKSVVLGRSGQQIAFNPNHLEFSGHYRFHPQACNIRSGWEKGRVERSIRYIRDNFFAGRSFKDLSDANRQLECWLNEIANKRSWSDDRNYSIMDKFSEEKPKLLPLPEHDGPSDIMHPVRSGKLPFVRFDLNDYSIPYLYVGKPLSLIAQESIIRIFDNQLEVAQHVRSYGKGKKIRTETHFTGLLEMRSNTKTQTKQEALVALIPRAQEFIAEGEILNLNRFRELKKLATLIDEYGVCAVSSAIEQALARQIPRSSVVAQILYEKAARSVEICSMQLDLPERQNIKNLSVPVQDLGLYDKLVQE